MPDAQEIAAHLRDCTDAQAALVCDGNADEVVARMVAAGWKLRERVDFIGGKRIRFLEIPEKEEPSAGGGV